jgi:MATE family, multidrug efflux pump
LEITSAAASTPSPSAWATIREAIRGTHQDFTEAPVGRAVVLLAVPMVLEMLMESVFVVADLFFVGRLGPEAIATVGITESLMTTIYAVAIGMTIGATAVVARRVGEKNPDQAARAAVQSILLGVFASVILGAIGILFGPQLLAAMGADAGVLRTGSTFPRVMIGGSGTVLLLFLINAVFRGAGDAALAMRVLWLANGINIVLGPCFIFGLGPFPELGVVGAAVGTTIGRGCGVLYQLSHLLRADGRIVIRREHLGLDVEVMKAILRISGTATFQNFVGTASWMGLVYILTSFGSDAVAGNTIGIRIIIFACLPAWGVSNAAATLVGQNLGAGKPERAEAAAMKAAWYNTACLGAVGVVFLLFAPQIVSLFSSDPEVAAYGVNCLRIVAAGFPFYGFAYVMIAAFNGSGDTRTPTVINVACLWLWELPLAWALAHPGGFGPTGVFIAVAVAFSTMAVVSTTMFRRGQWKTRTV